MHEIARVTLENEMDLILAHKRSMKLGELASLSLAAQTSFATAVSEVARNTIEYAKGGCLILQVDSDGAEKFIVAQIKDELPGGHPRREGLTYAKRLVNKYHITTKGAETSIELFYNVSPHFRIDLQKVDEWRRIFRNEPPLSAYDELKRKNEQLQELSEKLRKSEAQYKTLTNTLPLIIFSLDKDGQLLYANEWLTGFTGETIDSLNQSRWKNVVHEADYFAFSLLIKNIAEGVTTLKTQARLKHRDGSGYYWHQVALTPFRGETGELLYWIGYIVDIHAEKMVEETLKDNAELKETQAKLEEYQSQLERSIEELDRSNRDLEHFAFVASHDLQEPVRKLLFYSDFLLSRYSTALDAKGANYLQSMQRAAQRMRNLIQDLLTFSRINKEAVAFKEVDLNSVINDAVQDFEIAIREQGARLNIAPLPRITGDERMMRQLFQNLISNALKYAKPAEPPVIDISVEHFPDRCELAFKDNGIGFNEKYLPHMFALFQRLHPHERFDGTGLGLAICHKVVEMHGGKIWAKATEGEGATFFVSLPIIQPGS